MNVVERISQDLRLEKDYLNNIVDNSSYYYKNYFIDKRNGGKREIFQPSPELKTLQYWLNRNIFDKLPCSGAVAAYKKGCSIKKHAMIHVESKNILHADIRHFFPAIKPDLLKKILDNNEKIFYDLDITDKDYFEDIKRICFKDGVLCIGAVSSPIISNIVMFEFDKTIMEYCKKKKYKYTRYADDIYISSDKYIEKDVLIFLEKNLAKLGLVLNKKKTHFYSTKYKRVVTGIILTEKQEITIGTNRRKKIKSLVYNKLKHGKGDSNSIMGYLSYLRDIEPKTYDNLIIKYSKYCNGDIIKNLRK